MRTFLGFLLLFASLGAPGCATQTATNGNAAAPSGNGNAAAGRAVTYTYEVVNTYPHDPSAFTQGLIFHDGALIESTGLEKDSTLRRVELQTGRVLQKVDVPRDYFAEGMTLFGGK